MRPSNTPAGRLLRELLSSWRHVSAVRPSNTPAGRSLRELFGEVQAEFRERGEAVENARRQVAQGVVPQASGPAAGAHAVDVSAVSDRSSKTPAGSSLRELPSAVEVS